MKLKTLFLLVSVVGGLTPGASAPGNPPPGPRKRAMHLGKKPEQRQDPDSTRTARRHDHGQRRRQEAPPAAQAGGPGGAEDTPKPRHHAQQVDPPTLDSGPTTTTDHRHPGPASAPTADAPTDARRHHPRRQGRHQRRPTTIYTHHRRQTARTPATRPCWTTGPAADRPRRPTDRPRQCI